MPTYDYECQHCRHAFELFQQMSDPVKRTCPKCRKPKLQRLIGAGAGVLFKGGGFYETDYRSESYKKSAEAEKKVGEGSKSEGTKAEGVKAPGDAVGDGKGAKSESTASSGDGSSKGKSVKKTTSRGGKKKS